MMKFMLCALAAIAICADCAVQVRADILFSDYGPSHTYNTGGGWAVSGGSISGAGNYFAQAGEFTPSQTGEVTSVAFGISLTSGTNSVIVDLMTNNDGAPASVLESWNFSDLGQFGDQNPLLTASSPINPILVAGTNYWVAVFPGAPNTSAAWNFNNQDVLGVEAFSHNGGVTWSMNPASPLGAFEIDGTPASVPEPACIAGLFGLAIMGLLGLGRKQWGRES